MKGTETFPSSFKMDQNTVIQQIEAMINRLLEDMPDVFLVSLKIKPTNNFKIFLDADGGLTIERCVKINRTLYRQIEENSWYPDGNFSLEVSSAGVDEPLKMLRQYKKNVGRKVDVLLNDEARYQGRLTEAVEQSITIEYTEGKNKKAVTITKKIPLEEIKQTTVIITF